MELFNFKNIRHNIKNDIPYLIDIKDKLGYESSLEFFKYNKNTIFNNQKLIPNDENIINIGKTKNKNDFILSFNEMRGHIFLIDEKKTLLNKMIDEIIIKRSGLFVLEDENIIEEKIKHCIENNKEYFLYKNDLCFSIMLDQEINKDILSKLIILIMGKDSRFNYITKDVYNFIIENKKEEVFFSKEIIDEIIDYINDKYGEISEVVENLEKLKYVFSDQYIKENDISEKMLNYKNIFIYSQCSFVNQLSVILVQKNIYIDFYNPRDLEDYCIVIPCLNKSGFGISPIYFSQCRSMGNKLIIYSKFLDSNNNYYNENTNITIQEIKKGNKSKYLISHDMKNDIIELN